MQLTKVRLNGFAVAIIEPLTGTGVVIEDDVPELPDPFPMTSVHARGASAPTLASAQREATRLDLLGLGYVHLLDEDDEHLRLDVSDALAGRTVYAITTTGELFFADVLSVEHREAWEAVEAAAALS